MVTRLDSAGLRAIVYGQKKPALVLFSGPWCIDCRNFQPTWEAWTTGRVGPIYAISVERGSPVWDDWSIDEIPTVAVYSEGRELMRARGTIGIDDLDRLWSTLKNR